MKSPLVLSPAVQIAVTVIVLLGMLGGSLIVAHSGFGTSPRRGGPSTFVPAPEAYFLAATMYGMSIIGMLAMLQERRASRVKKYCCYGYVCGSSYASFSSSGSGMKS